MKWLVKEGKNLMSKIETDKVREIAGQPEKYFQDYQLTVEKVDKSGAVYHGKTVPFLYVPKIFTSQDICRFGKAMQELFKIVDHTIELYMKHAGPFSALTSGLRNLFSAPRTAMGIG